MTTPRQLLAQAQTAIAKGDTSSAIAAFTVLIDAAERDPTGFNPVLAVLSRSSCRKIHMQSKNYTSALQDALTALKLANVKTPQELYPGCYSSRSAAASYAADASRALGNQNDFMAYKRMATELMKNDAKKAEQAEDLKGIGNRLFKEGKLSEALDTYKQAISLDNSNAALLSNTSLVMLRLGLFEDALNAAERCVNLKPEWPKGYFRKGNVLLALARPTEAAKAFQESLEITPDDVELKQVYMEAVKRANITPESNVASASLLNNGGTTGRSDEDLSHAKKMMGMMMDLRYNSFDVKEFFAKSPHLVDFSQWSTEVTPLLTQRKNIDFIQDIIGLIKRDNSAFKITDMSYKQLILPEAPLISSLILLRLFTTAASFSSKAKKTSSDNTLVRKSWTLAFTHQATAFNTVFAESSSSVLVDQVSLHKTYAVLIDREAGHVFDFLAVWDRENGGGGGGENGYMGKILASSSLSPGTGGVVVYTCDDWKKAQEYVEGFYDGLNAEKKGQKQNGKKIEKVVAMDTDQATVPDSVQEEAEGDISEIQMENYLKIPKAPGKRRKQQPRVCFGLLTKNDLVDVALASAVQMAESGPDIEAEAGLERSNLTLSDTSEEEEADKMEMDLDNDVEDGVALHHCERCVLIRPLAQTGYEDGEGIEESEDAADFENVSTLDSGDGQSSVSASVGSSKVYRHCLADFDTAQAARAAAAVAEQLQTQQMLLMTAIDYALVYALHSFVATLEGQVCVLKGDPLALLDDSNSYWWLIGYIPAENIETPSERIARLNRIRNVQLALVADVDFDQVVPHTDHEKPLRFASSPVVFEEYFLGEEYYDEEDIGDDDLTSAAVDDTHTNLNLGDENSVTASATTTSTANVSIAINSSLFPNDSSYDASTAKLVASSKKPDNSNKQDDERDDSSISEKRESFWVNKVKEASKLTGKANYKLRVLSLAEN
ncbi:hypothetical protein HK100_010531 [Physocladia obscura]|uniref:Uncharacterized protein n=1 Tax=Physocladia obscura TaxID=109957 RepID=A0AAD5T2X7_9FUNG|nr:hypothetical protein HK100_010531 [Physocladia obscura]